MTKKVIVRLGKLERLDTWSQSHWVRFPLRRKGSSSYLLAGAIERHLLVEVGGRTEEARVRRALAFGRQLPVGQRTGPDFRQNVLEHRYSAACEEKKQAIKRTSKHFSSNLYDLFFRYKIYDWSKTRFASGYFFHFFCQPLVIKWLIICQ